MRRPFGLRRRIFWSLVGSMIVAGLLAAAVFSLWSSPSRAWSIAFFALLFLWLASGRLAFRLVRPLNRLVGVVQRIGQGDFSARARFAPWSRDEVSRVAHAIDDMAERIERQMREEKQLLAVVSHELRTPLARIRVLTELARDGNASALGDIDREVAEMDSLVSDILARSRLEFGTLAMRPIRLIDAVKETLERSGLPQSLLQASGDGVVTGDATLLHRALANLVDNARKHGGGVDRVEVRASADGIAVEVFDRGPGFVEGGAEDRFQAFRSAGDEGRGSGLGLGLSLVRRIVEAHRGRVWAENRSEGGARVGFELPVGD